MSKIHTVNLPDIGEGVVEGEVTEWLKNVGDEVQQDEPIVTVMTDKVTVELPAPYPGKLSKQYYQPGEIAFLDQPIYDLELEEALVPAGSPQAEAPEASAPVPEKVAAEPTAPKKEKKREPSADAGQTLAAPGVRRMAKDMGIDLSSVSGTGNHGQVTPADLKAHIASTAAPEVKTVSGSGCAMPPITGSTPILSFEDDVKKPILGIRRLISERMVESKYIVPHFSFFDQADCSRLIKVREKIKPEAKANGVELTYMPFFIRALSLALLEHPQVNASVDHQRSTLVIHKQQNIGIAMKLDEGLLVPVMKGVQDMALRDVILQYDDLKNRAMALKLDPKDMKESTITISNFGALGGRWATPVINYPEVAICGVARIRDEAVVKHGQIMVQPTLNLSWTFDHRVIDGDLAAAFSKTYVKLLENPSALL